jgi:hypothetical protein
MIIKSGLGLAVAVVAFALFAAGAAWMARRLIRSNQSAVIASLPLLREQTVQMESPGELVVSIEVPRLTTDYRQWEFEVIGDGNGHIHRMKWGGPRATGAVPGISTTKIPLGRLTLSRADKLTLRVNGLTPETNHTTHRIILARPHLTRMALQIVGLVFCGIGMLLSLIWGAWLTGIVKTA